MSIRNYFFLVKDIFMNLVFKPVCFLNMNFIVIQVITLDFLFSNALKPLILHTDFQKQFST